MFHLSLLLRCNTFLFKCLPVRLVVQHKLSSGKTSRSICLISILLLSMVDQNMCFSVAHYRSNSLPTAGNERKSIANTTLSLPVPSLPQWKSSNELPQPTPSSLLLSRIFTEYKSTKLSTSQDNNSNANFKSELNKFDGSQVRQHKRGMFCHSVVVTPNL